MTSPASQIVDPIAIHAVHGPGRENQSVTGRMISQTVMPWKNQNVKKRKKSSRMPSKRSSRPMLQIRYSRYPASRAPHAPTIPTNTRGARSAAPERMNSATAISTKVSP